MDDKYWTFSQLGHFPAFVLFIEFRFPVGKGFILQWNLYASSGASKLHSSGIHLGISVWGSEGTEQLVVHVCPSSLCAQGMKLWRGKIFFLCKNTLTLATNVIGHLNCVLRLYVQLTKLRKITIKFFISVRLSFFLSARNNSFAIGWICMKFDIYYSSKICRDCTHFLKIWQEQPVLCTKSCVPLWKYLTKFFFEWEMLQTAL